MVHWSFILGQGWLLRKSCLIFPVWHEVQIIHISINSIGFKNILSLHPPYLGAFKSIMKDDAMTQVYTCS